MTARKAGAMTRAEAAVIARAALAAKAPTLEQRFWGKVERRGEDDCWPWKAAVRNKSEGYGAFWLDGRHQPSNRVALLLSGVDVPDGMVACHRCDNPRCCNPKHLFVGTPLENNDDKVQKLRHAHGERNGNAKLTNEQVAALRAHKPPAGKRLSPGRLDELAAAYGITRGHLSTLIHHGRSGS